MTDQLERDHGYEAAERAAIYEYDAGMTRKDAEDRVRREIKCGVVIDMRGEGV